MRLDVYLCKYDYSASRQKAQRMISDGSVYVNGVQIMKPSYDVDGEKDIVEIKGEMMPYVSRGGLKLEAALDNFNIDVSGFTAVDIGASTGGFTDCLLKHGAIKVYAIDCGVNQLDKSLVNDSRVISIEKQNARYINREIVPELCDIVVMDVSFISQTLIYQSAVSVLKNGGYMITLIKPQFEAGIGNVGKHGIVKDKTIHEKIISNIIAEADKYNFHYHGHIESPIKGGDGNTEYPALFSYKTGEN
jgi:hemolysin TlyA family protein